MRHPISHIPQLSQREVYQLLQAKGSPWLKSHVLFADRKIVVVNKPPGFVCQLNHMKRKSKVCVLSACLLDSITLLSRSTNALLSSTPFLKVLTPCSTFHFPD